jgi:hypothetical protein
MTYRVYSGPLGSESIRPLENDYLLFKEFGALDEAISWARHMNEGDRVALLIEGDDRETPHNVRDCCDTAALGFRAR